MYVMLLLITRQCSQVIHNSHDCLLCTSSQLVFFLITFTFSCFNKGAEIDPLRFKPNPDNMATKVSCVVYFENTD